MAEPLLKQIELASEQITLCDRRIEELADGLYSETKALRKIPGVGALTALTYLLTLADKRRFSRSRDVGCYLGSDQNATNRATLTLNLASPKRVIDTFVNFWCKALITYSDTTDLTAPCGNGVSESLGEAEKMPKSEPLSLWPVSCRFCYTVCGSRKANTFLSMK